MRRFEGLVALIVLACGSRTELDTNHTPALRIGIFGDPGVRDESELRQFLSQYGSVVRTQTDATPLTADVLAGFDVVILDHLVREYSADESSALASWIASGGAMMSLTGYVNGPSDWTRPNSLVSPLDAVYEESLIMAGPSPETITQFDPHPLTTDLSAVVFWGGYDISVGTEWTPIAYQNNAVVGAARQYGSGRVFMWGDEWVEYTESFAAPDTKHFWANAIAWLRP